MLFNLFGRDSSVYVNQLQSAKPFVGVRQHADLGQEQTPGV